MAPFKNRADARVVLLVYGPVFRAEPAANHIRGPE